MDAVAQLAGGHPIPAVHGVVREDWELRRALEDGDFGMGGQAVANGGTAGCGWRGKLCGKRESACDDLIVGGQEPVRGGGMGAFVPAVGEVVPSEDHQAQLGRAGDGKVVMGRGGVRRTWAAGRGTVDGWLLQGRWRLRRCGSRGRWSDGRGRWL